VYSGAYAQTTFTESAASYNLDISGNKDGGHAWADYDNDGDLDVLVLENQNGSTRSYLMRNNGNNTFTDVRASLVTGMGNDVAERQAAWGDLNNDGRPDFMITSHGNGGGSNRAALQIYLQNANGTFGNGIGGNTPIKVGRSGYTININPINAEGAGFFDFEGDGDLDIFFDSHNYGIELLRNNYIDHTTSTIVNPAAASLFTHITTGNGSGVVQFGLNQFATDGDYGSAADVDDDGWVDIFMRKRNENDFFLNQGGTFTSGSDLAQADNGNKGGNGLWDLDNDGDLDAVWTENGLTQIFRNEGAGIWTSLGSGVFPGLPQPANANSGASSARIDALAGGDIDNDGDIDIILVGNNRSYLYINQLNSPTPAPGMVGSGAAMTFSLDSQTFNSGRDGEGTTMADVDDDGDLDIYISINGNRNQLYINNLAAANRNNHLLVDVTEDRDANGTTGGFPGRVAIGTNVLIRDCEGNIVSGLRQVNGVYGHGTQQPEEVHFGLPLGEGETYIIEVHYPNFNDPVDGITRLIATAIAQPSTIPGTNHYRLTTTDAELIENPNAPIANDDLEVVAYGNMVSVQISLFDNDSEPDGENFFIESVVQPAIGSVVIDDADAGLVTYTYSAGTPFPGTTFDYTITDSTVSLCPALGKSDTATVTVFEPCSDPSGIDTDGDGINDVCDLDDDNDGILDCTESSDQVSGQFGWSLNNPSGNLTMDNTTDPKINAWALDSATDMVFNTPIYSAVGSNVHIVGMSATNYSEAYQNGDYIEVSFTTANDVSQFDLNAIRSGWYQPNFGDSYYSTTAYSEGASGLWAILEKDVFHTDDNTIYATFQHKDTNPIHLKPNTEYKFRFYTYGQVDDSAQNYSIFDDATFNISACRASSSDGDGVFDHQDTDSDADGCSDANEAYADSNADGGDNEYYGTGNPPVINTDGTVSAASYITPADGNSNSTYDFQEADTAPAITVQPTDASICPGTNTTFSVTATNADTFQWQIWYGSSWVDLTNSGIHSTVSTNTLTISNAQTSDSGNQYQVLASNSAFTCAQEISNTTTLTVSEPTVDLGPNLRACDGDLVVLDATPTGGTPGYTYAWSTGATSPTISFNVTANPAGDFNTSYTVTVTDANGCSDTDTVVVRTLSRPSVTVTTVDATCGLDNGSITFTFPDYPNRSGIEFSLDDQATYEPNIADNSGSITYSNLSAGTYDLWSRWGNNECPIDLGDFTISTVPEVVITSHPVDQTVLAGNNAVFTASVSNADTYQWQVSTNGGVSFSDISDGIEYMGTQTTNLTVNTVDIPKSGYRYRVVASNSTTGCTAINSNSALLTVNVRTVITNRRITYRVNRN